MGHGANHRATSARVGWMEWGGDAGAGRGRVRRQLGAEDAAAGAVARSGAAEGHAVGAAAVDADVRRTFAAGRLRGAAGGHRRRRPRAGDLGRWQRLGAGGHPAGAGLSRDAVRRDHRQSGADAERVAAGDRDARQVQRRDPHAREPGALQRHERLHHGRVSDPRDLRGDVPGEARVAVHLAGRRVRVFWLRLTGHVVDAARRPVHDGGADRVPLRQLRQRRDDQRRLRLSGDGVRRDHDSALDRFERADPGGDARLRRRARGAVAELRPVGQSLSHAAAPPRRRELGDARGVSGRAARLPRRSGRRSLPARRHLHRRDVPDERERSAGGAGLPERQARSGSHGRDALPLRVQRPGRERQRRADGEGAADRQRLQLDQPHLRPLRPRRADVQLRAR